METEEKTQETQEQEEYLDLTEPQETNFDIGLKIPSQEDFDDALGSFELDW